MYKKLNILNKYYINMLELLNKFRNSNSNLKKNNIIHIDEKFYLQYNWYNNSKYKGQMVNQYYLDSQFSL